MSNQTHFSTIPFRDYDEVFDEDGTCVLRFRQIVSEDQGEYVCEDTFGRAAALLGWPFFHYYAVC